ncbi:MAG: DNA polymerase III subunit delta [Bacteroidota bacterium]
MAKGFAAFGQFLASLEGGPVSPVYFLHGGEDFLAEEATGAIVRVALSGPEREFNLDLFRVGETDIREVLAIASSFPMMADRRVVVLRDLEKLSSRDLEPLVSYLAGPSPSTTLILVGGKLDTRKKPYVGLKRQWPSVECKTPYENELPSWVEGRVRAAGRMISADASRLLVAHVGDSLRGLQSELDKLFTYMGDKESISADDVGSVVGFSREFSVFELQRAIGSRNHQRAAEILERMLDMGQTVPFILVMLTSYFSSLWKAHTLRRRGLSQSDMASELQTNPYRVKELVGALKHFSLAQIEQAFCLLAAADLEAKSTSAGPRQVMHPLLARLLSNKDQGVLSL